MLLAKPVVAYPTEHLDLSHEALWSKLHSYCPFALSIGLLLNENLLRHKKTDMN